MFFYVSKIFWTLAKPLNFIWLLILLGLVYQCIKNKQWPNKMLSFGMLLFLFLGVTPVGYNMLVFLETRYERPSVMPTKVDGIIVLGGGINAEMSHMTDMLVANADVTRVSEFVGLGKKYPTAKMVYSGGSGRIFHQDKGESAIAAQFLQLSAIDEGRIIYERKSRNTHENVKNSKEIVKPQEGEVWMMVTSMFHTPRSVGIFDKQGWEVVPYPSSPKTTGQYTVMPSFDVNLNFKLLSIAVREYIGCIVYYFSGKSTFLFGRSALKSHESTQT